jgi:hypothetical protein
MENLDPEKVAKLLRYFETQDPNLALERCINLIEKIDEMLKPFRDRETE